MSELIIITVATIIANAVGIISGFGTGTIMMPTLLLILPFAPAMMLSAIIVWVHNMWKVLFFRRTINWRLTLYFGAPGIITTVIGALLISRLIQSQWTGLFSKILGLILIGYVIFLFKMPHFKLKKSSLLASVGGSLQGFFTGLLGTNGPIRILFLIAYDLPKSEYLGTIGAISLLLDSARLITYWLDGMRLNATPLWGLLIFIPASYVGSKGAQYIVQHIPQERFRPVIMIFLLVLGLRLVFVPYV